MFSTFLVKPVEQKYEIPYSKTSQAHINLIYWSSSINNENLIENIKTLPPLVKSPGEQLPCYYNKSLFNVVLERDFSETTKLELIEYLFSLGYISYINALATSPLINFILDEPSCSLLLENIYKKYLFEENNTSELEFKIWASLLRKKENGIHLLQFLNEKNPGFERMIQYIEQWMCSLKTQTEAIDVYEKLTSERSLLTNLLRSYNPFIKKLAQFQILKLENESKGQLSQVASTENARVRQFLQSSEPYFYGLCIRHLSSYRIYRMFQDKENYARFEYSSKGTRLQARINEKLEDDLRRHAEFKLNI